jgi:hypothetical protein
MLAGTLKDKKLALEYLDNTEKNLMYFISIIEN